MPASDVVSAVEKPRIKSGDLLEFCIKADIRAVDEECRKEDVNPNIQDAEGNTPLIIAAEAGHTAIVELLLARFPHLEIDHVNHLGQSALMKAAIQGRITCVRALLRAGADTSLRDCSRSFRALDWAEYVGRTECVHIIAHFMVKSPKPTRPQFSAMISDLQNMTAAATVPLLGDTIDSVVPKHRPRLGSAPIPRLEITVAPDQGPRKHSFQPPRRPRSSMT